MTTYFHRLLVIVPVARAAALNAWIRNNLDATGTDWVQMVLSATGQAPATHGWFNAASNEIHLKKWLQRICTQTGISEPADWDSKTRAQKKAWFLARQAAIWSGLGVWIQPMDNDGIWDDAATILSNLSLQVISTA